MSTVVTDSANWSSDFVALHRTWVLSGHQHAGVILVPFREMPARDAGPLVRALEKFNLTNVNLEDQLVWLEP